MADTIAAVPHAAEPELPESRSQGAGGSEELHTELARLGSKLKALTMACAVGGSLLLLALGVLVFGA